MLKALSVDPAQRYPSTDAFARALMDELMLLSGMPSKVQIGEFVKAHCAAEYASTQALLTRASVLRAPPTQSMTEVAIEPTLASNPALRAVARATPAAPALEPPMSTAQLQAVALPPSKAPLVAAAALVVALTGLGGWALLSGRSGESGSAVGPAEPSAALKTPLEPVPPGSGKDDGSKPPEPPKEPTPVLVPPIADVVQAAPGDVVESKAVAELFVDGAKTYVRAGQGDGLVVGSTLVIVGAPQPDGKRTQLGTGTVMEVFPKMARVALDDAAGRATGARFAALGEVKVTAANVGAGPSSVEVKKAVDLFTDADKTYARAGQPDGLVVGQTLTIVSGPQANGRRLKLGTGTVMEVFPKMARLALDEQAAKAGGDRFVALGEVKVLATVGDTLEVKRAAEVFADGDKTYARAGQPEGLVPGQELFVVGAPLADGRRTKLGKATVMEVQGKLARLLLDADAGRAPAPRFVSLDAGGGGSTAQGGPVVGPAAGRPSGGRGPMTGKLKLQTAPIWSVFLENTSGYGWSACTLFAPGQRRYAFPSLISGARREFPVNLFVFDPAAPQLGNEVMVNCKEGSLRIPSM
ncbi:MAG: hypothetical protein INH37_11155 [Myxococcaceae bacterium]|nr:hypothetical protein [Myxococcaceae bacterium]